VANLAVTATEKARLAPYGQTVSLPAGHINVYRNGGTGPTMVLLSGYGTPAPAVDFAPLLRELTAFNVIVIEGFGYGYSDLNVANRTIENITGEIHEVLGRLGVHEPVILAGHSIGGIYTRYYANAYPGEVSAIIGIDPTPATPSTLEAGTALPFEGILGRLGLYRWVTSLAPDLIQPPGTAYTPAERDRTAAMSNWNYGNASTADEWAQLAANSTKASAHPFPKAIPVLEFLSSESVGTIPNWLEKHQAELADVTIHQIQIVEGAHYLHWTQAPILARAITDFVAAHVAG
jgi:pimeloyl-ACP methyl ester carboxylesterase